MSDRIFGIDLGTTNSCLAVMEPASGRPDPGPRVIEIDGAPIVPSVVSYDAETGEIVVGRRARNRLVLEPESTVRSIKRRMGRRETTRLGGRELSPEEIAAEILRYLKVEGEKALGCEIRRAVVTVPAYFEDAQRRATLRAGELAGLEVARILNEPTAAALVYDRLVLRGAAGHGAAPARSRSRPDGERILVYDLGGGTFDVSVVELRGELNEVRSSCGNNRLGGDDFDRLLADHLLAHLRREHGRKAGSLASDPRATARLTAAAEQAKIDLSSQPFSRVMEEALPGGLHLDYELDRATFEELVREPLDSTIIRRNTQIPVTRSELYHTVVDDQKRVQIEVFQGEGEYCSDNTLVGDFPFELEPAPADSPVVVEFSYDLDGIVRVRVHQKDTDNRREVTRPAIRPWPIFCTRRWSAPSSSSGWPRSRRRCAAGRGRDRSSGGSSWRVWNRLTACRWRSSTSPLRRFWPLSSTPCGGTGGRFSSWWPSAMAPPPSPRSTPPGRGSSAPSSRSRPGSGRWSGGSPRRDSRRPRASPPWLDSSAPGAPGRAIPGGSRCCGASSSGRGSARPSAASRKTKTGTAARGPAFRSPTAPWSASGGWPPRSTPGSRPTSAAGRRASCATSSSRSAAGSTSANTSWPPPSRSSRTCRTTRAS